MYQNVSRLVVNIIKTLRYIKVDIMQFPPVNVAIMKAVRVALLY